MSKTRVYQIANELKMSNEDVLAKLKELEINAVDKDSELEEDEVELVLEILKDEKEDTPILLLDDVLSELDNNRIEYLLKYIKPYQTVITTTEIDTLKPLCNISFYKVLNGSVEKLKNK